MQLEDGSELQNGKYRILRVLGQGGFGITYLVINTYFDKEVAIKEFFPKDFCGRDNTSHLTLGTQNNAETVDKLKARFLKEAKNISKLDHPGIVKILDIFEENNTAYYVMDYIEGGNLNEMIKSNGPLPEGKAVEYIKEVGEALDYIHSRNMTHFDVKPANIVVRKQDNYPILIDFGLSKQYDASGDATSTLLSGVSQGYSPIELYNPGRITSFSPQTDVYSLGATLYFLLTGKTPPSASEISQDGISLPTSVSTNISEAIEKAMETRRLKRYATIGSFLSSLNGSSNTSPSDYANSNSSLNNFASEKPYTEETKLNSPIINSSQDAKNEKSLESPNRHAYNYFNDYSYTIKDSVAAETYVQESTDYNIPNGKEFEKSATNSDSNYEIDDDSPNENSSQRTQITIAIILVIIVLGILLPSFIHKCTSNSHVAYNETIIDENNISGLPSPTQSQREYSLNNTDDRGLTHKNEPDGDEIFRAVEQQAEFPGGTPALMKWLNQNIRYPEQAAANDIQGRVIVKFVVEKDGSIGSSEIFKGVDKDLDREALRVVKKMPKWQPAVNNGVVVRSYFSLPVVFKLQ